MGDCLKSRDKMGLPDDLLLNWAEMLLWPHPGEGRRGGGQEREEAGSVQSGEQAAQSRHGTARGGQQLTEL